MNSLQIISHLRLGRKVNWHGYNLSLEFDRLFVNAPNGDYRPATNDTVVFSECKLTENV